VIKSLPFIVFVLLALSGSPSYAVEEEIVGPVTRESILERKPDWRVAIAAYQPRPEVVDRIRGLAREVRLEVYFGSWCPDCAAHLPAFFRILELADTPLLKVSYVGVPQSKDKRGPTCTERQIARVPTFVVFVDGREIGRIVETPEKSLEEDLAKILGL
jgi:thiol-disulfide isomerase/thioredoxin